LQFAYYLIVPIKTACESKANMPSKGRKRQNTLDKKQAEEKQQKDLDNIETWQQRLADEAKVAATGTATPETSKSVADNAKPLCEGWKNLPNGDEKQAVRKKMDEFWRQCSRFFPTSADTASAIMTATQCNTEKEAREVLDQETGTEIAEHHRALVSLYFSVRDCFEPEL